MNARTWIGLGFFATSLGWAPNVRGEESPLVLENQHVALTFDAATGTWLGVVDKQTDENLVVSSPQLATVSPAPPPKLDPARIAAAVAAGQAMDLSGDWVYAPATAQDELPAAFAKGDFSGVSWQPTPVPSRRGSGDDRLHERAGDFWYRREFTAAGLATTDALALVIGAVDDFDEVWLNGHRVGRTSYETPDAWKTPRLYQFPAEWLRRDQPNILLIKVTNAAFDGGIDGPLALGDRSRLQLQAPPALPLAQHVVDTQPAESSLSLVTRDGDFEYQLKYVLLQDRAVWSRQYSVTNRAAKPQVFRTMFYVCPSLTVGDDTSVCFPGSLPVGDTPLQTIGDGQSLGPRATEPLVALWSSQRQRGLGAWFYSEEEYSPVSVKNSSGGAVIRHRQDVIVRLQPGESVELGRQFMWLTHGTRDQLLSGVQDIYAMVGLRAPEGGLAGLRGMTMYCGHPGGPPELGYLRYGGFQKLTEYVPTLNRMHIDLLWLLPIWDHGTDKRWNLYSPFDHFQVDRLLGTAEDLKALSHRCAESKIQLMFDLVPHGPPDFTPLAKEHPEWTALKEDGSPQYEWSQLAFDNHHPGWQAYMQRAAEWDAREFAAVGARVDCAAGGPLNWNPQVTQRPSLSSLAAGLGMNRAIRRGFANVQSGVVLLPEEYTGANIFCGVGDLTYDAQLYYLQSELLASQAPPEKWAASLQQFLHDQSLTLPPGALKMRWISNHDTVSWTFQKQRPARAYGVLRMRALWSLCALIEGVPMVYQGDEDPAVFGGQGDSQVEFLSQLYGLRKRLDVLREGTADYLSAKATQGVFACLRSHGDQQALVLISFNADPVTTEVSLPDDAPRFAHDALSGERLEAARPLRVTMEPYAVRVLTSEQDE